MRKTREKPASNFQKSGFLIPCPDMRQKPFFVPLPPLACKNYIAFLTAAATTIYTKGPAINRNSFCRRDPVDAHRIAAPAEFGSSLHRTVEDAVPYRMTRRGANERCGYTAFPASIRFFVRQGAPSERRRGRTASGRPSVGTGVLDGPHLQHSMAEKIAMNRKSRPAIAGRQINAYVSSIIRRESQRRRPARWWRRSG